MGGSALVLNKKEWTRNWKVMVNDLIEMAGLGKEWVETISGADFRHTENGKVCTIGKGLRERSLLMQISLIEKAYGVRQDALLK